MTDELQEKFLKAGELAKKSMGAEDLDAYDRLNVALRDYLQTSGKSRDQLSDEEFQTILNKVPGARKAMLDYWDGTSRFLEVMGVEDPGKKKKGKGEVVSE